VAAQLMGRPLGGISMERDLVHKMQLMVMLSNAIVCGANLNQPYRGY
jgi:hypothetical protein